MKVDRHSYRIATININNITNQTKISALYNFIKQQDADIIFLQEVENDKLNLPGYNVVSNIDVARRGTAIALKHHIQFSNVERSLNSRLIALRVNESITLVNVYAHSGSQNRTQREELFNFTLSHYLRHNTQHIILGGDFNSVIRPCDATGDSNFSLALKNFVQHLKLHDVGVGPNDGNRQFTYITHNSASRIDRIYVSSGLRNNLRSMDTHVCSFTNHKAVTVRLTLPNLGREPGRGYWSLRPCVLSPENIEELQLKWDYWTRQRRQYNSWIDWWVDFAKPKLKTFFRWKTNQMFSEHNRKYQNLYAQLREAYDQYYGNAAMLVTINKIKGKMLKLQREFSMLFFRVNETCVSGEKLSTFQMAERGRKKTTIDRLEIAEHRVLDRSEEIENFVFDYFKTLYSEQEQEVNDVWSCDRTVPFNSEANLNCMNEITTEEIYTAIKTSASRKAAGPDGITKEFYLKCFDVIHRHLNLILNEALQGNIPDKFLDGVIILIKKKNSGNTVKSFRPISLLNFDSKVLSRILKSRLELILKESEVLSPSQKCSNSGKNIYQATLAIKDRIVKMRESKTKGKLISFDLDHAFDRVDHRFLFRTMLSMGINPTLIDLFSAVYARAKSKLLINGHLSPEIQIKRSVRQGDPLSMLLFVLYLQPLVHRLDQICDGQDDLVVVYADDVSVITTCLNKIERIKHLFESFGRCSGAVLNLNKTDSINIGYLRAGESRTVSWLQTSEKIKILGITFCNSVRLMQKLNWDSLTAKCGQLLWLHKMRDLTLQQKVVLLNTFITAKIWYVSSVLAMNKLHAAKLTSIMGSFLWNGMALRVPITQLALPYEKGGLNLQLPSIKSKALLISRHLKEATSIPFYTSFISNTQNPPNLSSLPANSPCLKQVCQEVSYLPDLIKDNPTSDVLHKHFLSLLEPPKVVGKYLNCDWMAVWRNIKSRYLSSSERSFYFILVNEKIAHGELLFRMQRVDSAICAFCNSCNESLVHKIAICPRVAPSWRILQRELVTIYPSKTFSVEDLIRPSMKINRNDKIKILKLFINYVICINESNNHIDTAALQSLLSNIL